MNDKEKIKKIEENIGFVIDDSKKNAFLIIRIPEGEKKERTDDRKNNHLELF